ncbi:hypothetical protein CAG58_04920 [Vibrio sp. V31_P5A7T61]|uniref:porin family protein n=1 Tax=unclassified Vibrio TaxID=2614977 RepID=UPI001372F96C|nr:MULTISPECIES: porin family protein [unclassified Vibrio]NAW61301.1 hypothetical protein [Vibrio sp. V31_P5A7T61]NAX64732.1 hypothetical protein [Vibrio sp. V32_P6A28T40]
MKSKRFLMMKVINFIVLILVTIDSRAENIKNNFYVGSSLHYNVNDREYDLTDSQSVSVRAGYLFTLNLGIESSYGSYGRNLNGNNIYAYQFRGNYLHHLDSDFTLYTGIGGYIYDSEINPTAVIGVKKKLDKKISTQFSYEYFYKGYGDDDIYSLSMGINFYF